MGGVVKSVTKAVSSVGKSFGGGSNIFSVGLGLLTGQSFLKIAGGILLGAVAQKAISWLQPEPEAPSFGMPQAETAQGVLIKQII
jgi:hypothetical protein